MSIEIRYHGVMCDQYFSGTSGVMLPLDFNSSTTLQDIFNQLKSEVDSHYEHISYVAENKGITDIDRVFEEIDDAIIELEETNDLDSLFYPNFVREFESEDFSDTDECPVAIFSIEFIGD